MNGKSIEPDCFDSVSIYLSDIAGFHSLLAVSTPKEVRVSSVAEALVDQPVPFVGAHFEF